MKSMAEASRIQGGETKKFAEHFFPTGTLAQKGRSESEFSTKAFLLDWQRSS
jgi:hypothetical protein